MDQNTGIKELKELVEEVDNEFNPYLGEILSEGTRAAFAKVGHC